MKINRVLKKSGVDFKAVIECEFCGYRMKTYGDDGYNFRHNILPEKVCPRCKRKTGRTSNPVGARYSDYTTL